MKIERVAPELRSAARWMPNVAVHSATVRASARFAIRHLMPKTRVQGVRITELNNATLSAFTPENYLPDGDLRPALLWLHGGGYVIGAATHDSRLCGETARRLNAVVVAVDYRLAPEHPFPTPLDDAIRAWSWLQRHAAELGVDPTRVAIGGKSAGGGLAAAAVQRILDHGITQPVAQWLLCPMLDDRTAARRELDSINHRVWNNRANRYSWSAYLGHEPGRATAAPYAVPARRENMAGLPPAWIAVGDIDLFHEEDVRYAQRLEAAGVETTLDVVAGAPHGFESWAASSALSRGLISRGHEWLAAHLWPETATSGG